MNVRYVLVAMAACVSALSNLAFADDSSPPVLTIHYGQFGPKELSLPAGVKLKLVIRNQDSTPAEFESYDLSREVIVPAHGEATIYVGPLKVGSYKFFNDFDQKMQGSIIVKPSAGKGG